MNTPQTLFGVDKGTFFEWEALRCSGLMNMGGAPSVLGLTKEETSAFFTHYGEMKKAWLEEFEKGGFAKAMTFGGGA